jgi:hypothetical protein
LFLGAHHVSFARMCRLAARIATRGIRAHTLLPDAPPSGHATTETDDECLTAG